MDDIDDILDTQFELDSQKNLRKHVSNKGNPNLFVPKLSPYYLTEFNCEEPRN
jgi:hypothetical protein